MTNEEKLDFIKANYKSARCWELLQGEEKLIFYEEWIKTLMNIIPTNLYKYRSCNEDNLKMLQNKTAWFSCPSTWNDPIDVTVSYDLDKDADELEKNFDHYVFKFAFAFINKYIESFCNQKKFVTQEQVREVYYKAFEGEDGINVDRIIAYLEPVVGWKPARQIAVKTQEAFMMVEKTEFKEQIVNGFRQFLGFNDIRTKMFMYSLSETYENNHQWAMYADGGKGFCIGYEIKPKSKEEASMIPNLLPIYYGEKDDLLLSRMLDETLEYVMRQETLGDLVNQESESLYVALHTKTLQWIGEEEWRFIIPIDQAKYNAIPFDFAKSIYLGENIEPEWKERLISIAKEQNLKIYQRQLNRTKSKWIYSEVSI